MDELRFRVIAPTYGEALVKAHDIAKPVYDGVPYELQLQGEVIDIDVSTSARRDLVYNGPPTWDVSTWPVSDDSSR